MNSALQRKGPPVPERKLPITVTCVLKELNDYNNPDIHAIRDHCNSIKLMFETRQYDSYKYRYDRDEISRLPAFHISVNDRYEKTFYLNTRPYDHIREIRIKYLRQIEEVAARKHAIRSFFQRLFMKLKGAFRRKTLMEKVAEAEAAANAKASMRKTIRAWE